MQEEEERRRSQHRELQQALEVQLREAEQVWLHPGGGGGPRGEGPPGAERRGGGAWAGGGATHCGVCVEVGLVLRDFGGEQR